MNTFLMCFTAGECFLLSFLLFFHTFQQNLKANKWLSLFVFIMGTAFIGVYLDQTGSGTRYHQLLKWINSLQFLLAPSLYISILFFVTPTKFFKAVDWLHFLPFLGYAVAENVFFFSKGTIATRELFEIDNTIFLIRDLLPFQLLAYVVVSYALLIKHKANLRFISSAIEDINLNWLRNFLVILGLVAIFWINDAIFEAPLLLYITPFVYTFSVFFLAYFALKQKNIYAFDKKDLEQISEVLDDNSKGQTDKQQRLSDEQLARLSVQLDNLMINEKVFLDNEVSLPIVAGKLGIGIHDTSYLINQATGGNFYNFINKYRVEEAKKLLTSAKMDQLNILGIAFASGFNSKTAFNTAFKKWVGVSPTAYVKANKNQ